MTVWWWRAGVLAWIAGCGPRVEPPSGGGTDGGSSTGMASTGLATTGGAEASSSDTESTTREATSSDASSDAGSSSSSGIAPPEVVEIEGLLEADSTTLLLRPCDDPGTVWAVGGDVFDLWPCTGAYAHIRGFVVDCPGGCSMQVVQVDEVLEARLCEPGDCGGTQCEAVECIDICEGSFECERGSKCVPWAPPGLPYLGRRCVEVDADPVGVGEACQEDAAEPWVDDCDATSVCMGERCIELCDHQSDCPDDACMIGNEQAVRVCAPYCNPLVDACPSGNTCIELLGVTGCLPDAELPLLEDVPCEDGTQCDPTSMCLDADAVPGCTHDTCCSPLCDTSAPACPGASMCAALWEDAPPGLETLGVCRG